jgi:hypothetical protein
MNRAFHPVLLLVCAVFAAAVWGILFALACKRL